MQRWWGLEQIPPAWGPSVVTVGVFDGVHRGHVEVVARVVARARARGAAAVVVTFDPHPLAVLRPDSNPAMLASLDRRMELLAELGVDAVCVLQFTPDLAGLGPEEFATTVLADRLRAVDVVVGENFRFGHKAAGDVTRLAELGVRLGFAVEPLALAGQNGRWSSTRVRACLETGDVAEAAAVLGRPYRLEGEVVVGDRRGRDLGYPTANLELQAGVAVPADGIYAGWLVVPPAPGLPAAISIGTNPTFSGTQRRVEAYALDRDDLDLYGTHVALDFAVRLRDTVRFSSVQALLEQMADDVRRAREALATVTP